MAANEGLKSDSRVHCDELVSLPKSLLTHYVGRLRDSRLRELNGARIRALDLEGAVEEARDEKW